MSVLKRVIPCLDVDKGRVVKGTNFVGLRDAGDPVELAERYDAEGADELVFLDITASHEERETIVQLARRTADNVFIPFTIGGRHPLARGRAGRARRRRRQGLRELGRGRATGADGRAGATRSARSAWCSRSTQKEPAATGRHRVRDGTGFEVFVNGGRVATGRDVVEWAREGAERGAGEILLTSMDRDGTKDGYDLELTRAVADAVDIPVIASGGAGELSTPDRGDHRGRADAVLVASIFHYGQYRVRDAKEHLRAAGIPVRI